MSATEIVICNPVRTAIGTYNGSLKAIPATELGGVVIAETLWRSGLPGDKVDTVIMGNVIQAGGRMNPARQAAIGGNLPVSVPALTVNRVCGSGAQAIASAAQEVLLGFADVAIAGGMENMDQAPYLVPNGRWGNRMGDSIMYDSMLRDGLNDAFSGQHSGWHTEDLVTNVGLSRLDQDEWAARSQQRFSQAQAAGRFSSQIVGVNVKVGRETKVFDKDESNRPETTVETLGKLKAAFRSDGTITAGNAPGLNSGAAAMIVANRAKAEHLGLEPVARLISFGVGAVEPGLFGLGPVPAIQQALARAGWSIGDVDRFEINEAFAAVPLALIRKLGINPELVNVDGGAIAHGHPIGASGAILTVRLVHSLLADGLRRGIVTLCIGGGQGIALALEVL
ncbi:thiolase family protein [Herbaspirillum lusitanum]|uniref:thiolase family protein n=1 Tax=Herbaspirillum lusitanum TaxID=213312 RepID=UPI002237C0D2|nr:thiolase family protein [Herbaspirillum lusitanum]MCW5297768.1 thiolase family protein [Herbaspirillum lusitanum]